MILCSFLIVLTFWVISCIILAFVSFVHSCVTSKFLVKFLVFHRLLHLFILCFLFNCEGSVLPFVLSYLTFPSCDYLYVFHLCLFVGPALTCPISPTLLAYVSPCARFVLCQTVTYVVMLSVCRLPVFPHVPCPSVSSLLVLFGLWTDSLVLTALS